MVELSDFLIKIVIMANYCAFEYVLNFREGKVVDQKSFRVGVASFDDNCLLLDNVLIQKQHRFELFRKDDMIKLLSLSFE
jgi:hypothetical protein